MPMNSIYETIIDIWEELERTLTADSECQQRIYRRLDLQRENGIRLSCVSPGIAWEMHN